VGIKKGVVPMEIQKTDEYSAFESFVKCSLKQTPNIDTKYNLSTKSYLNEYCTYKFGMHRQSGHTVNSLALLPMYFNNCLFIVRNLMMVKYYKDILKDFDLYHSYESGKINLISNNEYIIKEAIKGRHFDCVVVDCASTVSMSELEIIKKCCCSLIKITRDTDNPFRLFLLE
jgi:hypothetical protein